MRIEENLTLKVVIGNAYIRKFRKLRHVRKRSLLKVGSVEVLLGHEVINDQTMIQVLAIFLTGMIRPLIALFLSESIV